MKTKQHDARRSCPLSTRLWLLSVAGTFAAAPAFAQSLPCQPGWSDEFAVTNLYRTRSLDIVDLGSGPTVLAGGWMGYSRVLRKDGNDWTPLAFGPTNAFRDWGEVRGAVAFDDGQGPALFVVGMDPQWQGRVWRYTGTGWQIIASANRPVWVAAVFDDGMGPALYVGGDFTAIGGAQNRALARWRGQGHPWQAPTTLTPTGSTGVSAMSVIDGPSGPALYIGGNFSNLGNIARMQGGVWQSLGQGVTNSNQANVNHVLTIIGEQETPGAEPTIYIGGRFTHAGGQPADRVARWRNGQWETVGNGLDNTVWSMRFFGNGGERRLYAAGAFAGGIVELHGTQWQVVGGGTDGPVVALEVDLDQSSLIAAGDFWDVGGQIASGVAQWDGQTWSTPPVEGVVGGAIGNMGTVDLGQGEQLYIIGNAVSVGGVRFDGTALWDGQQWSQIPGSPSGVGLLDVAIFDDGTGPAVYAATNTCLAGVLPSTCNRIGKWTGTGWEAVGGERRLFGRRLIVFDDGSGPALYVARHDDVPPYGISRWNGHDWLDVGGSIPEWAEPGERNGRALAIFDDGTGPALYLGGQFTHIGQVAANHIARWDGTSWTALGTGIGPDIHRSVETLLAVEHPSGPRLYVGGRFLTAGGMTSPSIASWTGQTWEAVGSGIGEGWDWIYSLAWFDNGTGRALYAGGLVSPSHLEPMATLKGFFRFDGDAWSELPVNRTVWALKPWDDGGGEVLWLGGTFTEAGGLSASSLTNYIPCETPCYANCDGSTIPPILNVDDFACFIDRFTSAQSLPHEEQVTHYANCDGSTIAPVLNVDDFTCFINAFAAGCP